MADLGRYSSQSIDEEDIDAVTEVLRSAWLTQGPKVEEFERRIADYCGAAHAVAMCNGTAALHAVVAAAGVQPGDAAITSPITFVASAACARYCGAEVDFCDVTEDTVTLDPVALEQRAARWGDRLKVVVAVDFAGMPADLAAIQEVARRHGAIVIEDACHSLGAEYQVGGQWVRAGSCHGTDAAVFSFHPVKHITTGEGGMVVTNDADLAERCRRLRHHGIRRGVSTSAANPDPWYAEVDELGYNYRLTDLQSALGVSQLARLDHFVARRRAIAATYDAGFSDCPGIEVPARAPDRRSSYHLYYLRVRGDQPGRRRRALFLGLQGAGFGVQVHYQPVHLQPYYRQLGGFAPGHFPVAEDYYERTISLPCFPAMTDDDVARVVEAVRGLIDG